MKTALAVAGLLLTLQGAVLSYVIDIEHRMTRVEVMLEPRNASAPKPNPATPTRI